MGKSRRKQRSKRSRSSRVGVGRRSKIGRRSRVGRRSKIGRRSKSIGNNRRSGRKRRNIRHVQVGGPVSEEDIVLQGHKGLTGNRAEREAERKKKLHQLHVKERKQWEKHEKAKKDFRDQLAKKEDARRRGVGLGKKQEAAPQMQWRVQKMPMAIWKPGSGQPGRHHLKNEERERIDDSKIEVGDILLGPVTKWKAPDMGSSFWDFDSQKRVTWLEYNKIKKPNVEDPLDEHGWVQVGEKGNIVPLKKADEEQQQQQQQQADAAPAPAASVGSRRLIRGRDPSEYNARVES